MAPKAASSSALRQLSRCACPSSGAPAGTRAFSASRAQAELSRQRTRMYEWFEKLDFDMGRKHGGPHYLGKGNDQPFPHNPFFRSQPVLGEETRETVWRRVKRDGEPMKVVSAELGIDVRRVAAVVRLKEVEKRWVAEGRRLAKPYAQAMLAMLPQTSYDADRYTPSHEPINDVHVHGYTMQQVFLPTSESRHFTRHDAARAFHRTMLPAEERSQHPELIDKVKSILGGQSKTVSNQRFVAAARESEQALVRRALETKASEDARTMKIKSDRFEFRIQSFNSERVGPAGRARHATGWRYGAPLDDRKRGKVRIPTSVP